MAPVSFYVPVPLEDRLETIQENIEESDCDGIPENARENIRTFFLSAQAVFEERTAELICREIIDDSVMNEEIKGYYKGDAPVAIGQTNREDLLYRANVISGSLYSKLQKVRGIRNVVAHEYNYQLQVDWEGDLEKKAKMAVEAYEEILEKFQDSKSASQNSN